MWFFRMVYAKSILVHMGFVYPISSSSFGTDEKSQTLLLIVLASPNMADFNRRISNFFPPSNLLF